MSVLCSERSEFH